MHRFQIATFGSIAVVFAVIGVNQGIFSGASSLDAMAAGWLILAMVNIVWVLYFTSEEDSLMLHVFNSLGTGGLTPPSRRRRGTRAGSMMNMGGGNGYTAGYSTGGIGPMYDSKMGGSMTGPIGGNGSFRAASVEGGAARSLGGAGSIHNVGGPGATGSIGGGGEGSIGPASPLMGSGAAGIGAGGGGSAPVLSPSTTGPDTAGATAESHQYRAKALYNCECLVYLVRSIICLHGNPPSRHRLRGRPQRDLLHKGGDTGDSRQEREVVASEKIRRDGRK